MCDLILLHLVDAGCGLVILAAGLGGLVWAAKHLMRFADSRR